MLLPLRLPRSVRASDGFFYWRCPDCWMLVCAPVLLFLSRWVQNAFQHKSSILFTAASWSALSADELSDIQPAVLFWYSRVPAQGSGLYLSRSWRLVSQSWCLQLKENGKMRSLPRKSVHGVCIVYFRQEQQKPASTSKLQCFFTDKSVATVSLSQKIWMLVEIAPYLDFNQ